MEMVSHKTAITRAMTVIGFLSLSLSDELSKTLLFVMGAVTLLSLIIISRRKFKFSPMLWNILAVIVFAVFLLNYLTQQATFVASIASLTLILVVLKLFDLNKPKDYLFLYILVFFQLLASAVSTISPLFLLILAAFIITSIWAMTAFTIQRDYSEAGGDSEKLPKGTFSLPFFTATIIMTLATFIMTLGLFFLLPRIDIGLFEKKTTDTLGMTGFSETVNLGLFGELKRNSAIVMRVGIPEDTEPPRFTLYLRGTALESYDGEKWIRDMRKKLLTRDKYKKTFSSPLEFSGNLREYNIALEALDTNVLFTVAPWKSLKLSEKFHSIWSDKDRSIYLPAKPFSKVNYTLKVPDELNAYIPKTYAASEKAARLKPYLNIEAATGDVEKITLLTREITKDALNTEYAALAIERYLEKNYAYTLNPKRDDALTPLDNFLFSSKEGYCEHYATAMAIMLRTIDIPSRIVTGFLQGEWNDYGNYYLIRQQDAHSWVEAYIDGLGWVRFDPTPSVAGAAPSFTSRIALYLDALKWKWTRSIVNFTFKDQMDSTQTLAEGVLTFKGRLSIALKKLQNGDFKTKASASIIFILIAAAIVAVAILATGKRRPKKAEKTPGFYILLLSLLKKRSLTRLPSETPMAFALRTGIRDVVEVTRIYEKVRYGDYSLTSSESNDLKGLLTRIKGLAKADALRAASG